MKSNLVVLLLGLGAAALAGCAKGDAGSNERIGSRESSSPSSEEPRVASITVPAGTAVVATLETPLATDTNRSGDSFTATTSEAVVVDGRTVIPAGARVSGTLRDVQASGRVKGRARMTLGFDRIVDASGTPQDISAQPLTLQADSGTRDDVEKIAAGTVLGAIIGGVTKGEKGAVVGGAIGAGAGTIVVLATKGEDVELNPGQQLNVVMTAPASLMIASRN